MKEFDVLYLQIIKVSHSTYHTRIKNRLFYTWNKIHSLIPPNGTVVEMGVGPMAVLAKQLGGANVIGIDLNNYQSALCNEFGIDLRISNVENSPLPLEDESVDVLLLLEIIEHLCIYPNDLFDEIFKKLKKGGNLVVSTVNFLRFSNRIRVLLGKSPLIDYFERTSDGRNHLREFLPAEVSHYMERSGFSIVGRYSFGVPVGNPIISILLRLIYLYPAFRNYFLIIGKK